MNKGRASERIQLFAAPKEVDDAEDFEHEDEVDGPGVVDLRGHLHRRRVGFQPLRVEGLLVDEVPEHEPRPGVGEGQEGAHLVAQAAEHRSPDVPSRRVIK